VLAVCTPPSGDLAGIQAKAAAFFDQDASEERKQALQDNLAKLPSGASLMEKVFAHAPMRFFDARFDPAPMFAEAVSRPGLLLHVMATLARGWDVSAGSEPLRVPLFVALGRYDYVVPHFLWDNIAPNLPNATRQLFEHSGHQPFFEEPDLFAAAVTSWIATPR